MTNQSAAPLDGVHILDLADESGLQCTKLLADLGADVVKVEPPAGDAARRRPPFAADRPGPDRGLFFLHYYANKRSITLDLQAADGRALFRRLAERADIVVETCAPGYLAGLGLGFDDLHRLNAGLVLTSITPFGQEGPYARYRASELTSFAMGGLMALSGEPSQAPSVAPGDLAHGMAGAYAAYGTLVAYYHRLLTGQGQMLDVSIHECSAHIAGYAIPTYSARHEKAARMTRAKRFFELHDVYPCQDGHVRFFVLPRDHWLGFREWIGSPPELMDPVFEDQQMRRENSDLIDPRVTDFAQGYTKEELFHAGQRRHLAVTPVYRPEEYAQSPQIRARGFFVEVEHPEVGLYQEVGPLHKLGRTPGRVRRPPPRIGQHNQEIYCQGLGLAREELMALRAGGAI